MMAIAYQSGDIINDQYRITAILGKGGVAITYSAIALETESNVAIKVISLKQLKNWKEIELFQREAEVLAKLDHPTIPQYIDYFTLETEKDKAFYLVQQQAPGKSLAQLIENGWRTTEKEVKDIAQQILEILIYLHSLDPTVIHRDIKPNNLIRSEDGKIYLVDFGAVQNTYYNTLMQGSTVVGTYGYMAPEQFRGKALPATDLYSLGATLLYLLTHRSPAELPQDTLKLDFRNSVDISESFADWLDKILEPDIEDRFTSGEIALDKLFTSKQVKQKKVITSLGIGVLMISVILGFSSYKWWFLSRLGFYPTNICFDATIIENYIKQGGKPNINVSSIFYDENPILNCILDSSSIETSEKVKLIDKLIKKGADVNAKDQQGYTALFKVIYNYNPSYPFYGIASLKKNHKQRIEVVKLLIENGADVNFRDNSGRTLLFYTIDHENTDIAKLLIDNGADVNAKDNLGQNVLFMYGGTIFLSVSDDISYPRLGYMNKDIFKLLIESGANINARNYSNETLLSFWEKGPNRDIVNFLIQYNEQK